MVRGRGSSRSSVGWGTSRGAIPPVGESDSSIHASHAEQMGNFLNEETAALRERSREGSESTPPTQILPPPTRKADYLRAFKSLDPPTFTLSLDPLEAVRWLKEVRKVLRVVGVLPQYWVEFATYLIQGEAEYLWDTIKDLRKSPDEEYMSWELFEECFLKTYISQPTKYAMRKCFRNLKQDDMTVTQYLARFSELSRFATDLVATEELKAMRFEEGLAPAIYMALGPQDISSFATVVERALNVEASIFRGEQEERVSKRTHRPLKIEPIQCARVFSSSYF